MSFLVLRDSVLGHEQQGRKKRPVIDQVFECLGDDRFSRGARYVLERGEFIEVLLDEKLAPGPVDYGFA